MEWNILLVIGFALRIYYHIVSEDYPFGFTSAEAKKNLKLSTFSFLLVAIAWYLSYFLHFDDHITDGWKLVGLWVLYVVIGWAIDSLFLFVMDMGERVIKKWIGGKANDSSSAGNDVNTEGRV
jgi:heme/copper-type cytochrome/quinol oxidase subunit 4